MAGLKPFATNKLLFTMFCSL